MALRRALVTGAAPLTGAGRALALRASSASFPSSSSSSLFLTSASGGRRAFSDARVALAASELGGDLGGPAPPRVGGGQPQAPQWKVFAGVCVGLGLASLPLWYKSVRQREQGVSHPLVLSHDGRLFLAVQL